MTEAPAKKHRVLCVDDNPHVAEALRSRLSRQQDLTWVGCLPDADGLAEMLERESPDVVLLDLDMPGRDPLEVLSELSSEAMTARVIVFSGHVRKDLINRAINAGAWGYISKGEGEEVLLESMRRVLHGEFVLSSEVRSILDA